MSLSLLFSAIPHITARLSDNNNPDVNCNRSLILPLRYKNVRMCARFYVEFLFNCRIPIGKRMRIQ